MSFIKLHRKTPSLTLYRLLYGDKTLRMKEGTRNAIAITRSNSEYTVLFRRLVQNSGNTEHRHRSLVNLKEIMPCP